MWKILPLFLAVGAFSSSGQISGRPNVAGNASISQQGLKLAQQGDCRAALPLLQKSLGAAASKELKQQIGFSGVRCAMTTNQPGQAASFVQALQHEFPDDPQVLYFAVHTYSDLSTQAGERLSRVAPNSHQARELNAEALELQGKWDDAEKEYQQVLAQDPNVPGVHFRLGRLLLSRPGPPSDVAERAKKEFEQELAIDPTNPGAEFILGELARQQNDLSGAIDRFSRAIKLDNNFGDAYLGLGTCLVASKKYADAIPPLETAVKLEPGNPAAHFNLATALGRSGRKEEAEKEFAIHRNLMQAAAEKTKPDLSQ